VAPERRGARSRTSKASLVRFPGGGTGAADRGVERGQDRREPAAFHNFFDNPPEARREPSALERLSEIKVPTSTVVGERDAPDNRAIPDTPRSGISGAEKVVAAAAPMPNPEKPEESDRLVARFLEGLEAGASR
jgi:pimeloyl-ACP methyl ester carboxylesterase